MAQLQKSIDKRTALLKATLTLVNNGGIQEASMAKIAKIAAVSPATIYLFFQSKQDLVSQLYLTVKSSFAEAAFSDYNLQESVEVRFKKIWFNMVILLRSLVSTLFSRWSPYIWEVMVTH